MNPIVRKSWFQQIHVIKKQKTKQKNNLIRNWCVRHLAAVYIFTSKKKHVRPIEYTQQIVDICLSFCPDKIHRPT